MQHTPSGTTPKPATAARIYDYLLGGVHNFPADREAARAVVEQFPDAPAAMRANRAFLGRAVRYLAEAGVRQFLDLGSGIPTEGNVHEIAQAGAPEARVVYVDLDPVAVSESLEILGGNPLATAIRADLREPDAILRHPQFRRVIDLNEPVALLMAAVLHFLPEDAQAYGLVERLLAALPAGSYLLVSHAASETFAADGGDPDELREVYRRQTATPGTVRTHAEVLRFFAGLELVEPGVVWTSQWRANRAAGDPPVGELSRSGAWCGVARKPVRR